MTEFQVGPETFYTLKYGVFDAEGETVAEGEVLSAVFGMGRTLPAVEQKAEGLSVGAQFEAKLPPGEAFGPRRDEAILEVDRSEFPPDVKPGDSFEVENADGGILIVHVLDVHPEVVVIDTNHPLAGQEIAVRAEILEVRPATSDEMSAAEAEMQEDAAYLAADAPDVTLGGLLKTEKDA